MFASGTIDAVVVATPGGNARRRSRATRSTPGMHVYCEKPIAPTADEGYALARHAREAQRTLQVGFQFRFHKGYAALRDAAATISPLTRVNLERDELVPRAARTSTPARGARRGRWPAAAC